MRQLLFGRYSGPLIALGGILAVACLASTWYINRLQSDLSRAVRHDVTRMEALAQTVRRDVARMEAAEELQIRLRSLRLHYLIYTADPSPERRTIVANDRQQVEEALADARRESAGDSDSDRQLLDRIEANYRRYEAALADDAFPDGKPLSARELIAWSDKHPVAGLLVPCRELVDRHRQQMAQSLEQSEVQREQMAQSLEQSDAQTTWAGRVLLGLGLAGALGGVLAGYATARGLSMRAHRLSVRVRAVQAQLDQEVGEMTLDSSPSADVDSQLDRVIGRVKEVCQRLQDQERDLLRAEQLAAVGHLAAGVAHEIRNPLTGIKFLVEAALRPANPAPLEREDLRMIRQEIVRMERTIQGLLDYARTPPLNRRPHDFRDLVTEAVGVARSRAEAKQVRLDVVVPDRSIPASVDRDQVLSLLTNLLYNAIEASPPESAVDITAAAKGNHLQVRVCDRGPGIDPAVANRLGTPFVTTKPTGTGLGLTIARRIARDHGGTLTAANRPDGGACFTVEMPLG